MFAPKPSLVDGGKPSRNIFGRGNLLDPNTERAGESYWDIFSDVLDRVLDESGSAVFVRDDGTKTYVNESGIRSLSVERVRFIGLGIRPMAVGKLVTDLSFNPHAENVDMVATFTPDHYLTRSVRLLRAASQEELCSAMTLITDLARDHQRITEAVPYDHENEI